MEKLHEAVENNQMDALSKLIAQGNNVNSKRDMDLGTPLHLAVQTNNVQAVKILLEAGADPGAYDIFEATPRYYLEDNSDPVIIEMLAVPEFPERFQKFLGIQLDAISKEEEKGQLLRERLSAVNWVPLINEWAGVFENAINPLEEAVYLKFYWEEEAIPQDLFLEMDTGSGFVFSDCGVFFKEQMGFHGWEESYHKPDDYFVWSNIFFGAIHEAIYLACEKTSGSFEQVILSLHPDLDPHYIMYENEMCEPGWAVYQPQNW